MIKINPANIVVTCGVMALQGKGFENSDEDYLFRPVLSKIVNEQFEKEPEECLDGGNDKSFFAVVFRGMKLFCAANEVNGLTVMLPEEY